MVSMELNEAMMYASKMAALDGWPRCYYWHAVWWRLHAKESKNKIEAIKFSRNLIFLYNDIKFRREHYIRKPKWISDFERSK